MGQIDPQNMGVSNIHGEGVQAVAPPPLFDAVRMWRRGYMTEQPPPDLAIFALLHLSLGVCMPSLPTLSAVYLTISCSRGI